MRLRSLGPKVLVALGQLHNVCKVHLRPVLICSNPTSPNTQTVGPTTTPTTPVSYEKVWRSGLMSLKHRGDQLEDRGATPELGLALSQF